MSDYKKTVRPRGTDSAKVIQVIQTNAIKGLGTQEDPVRYVTQYWNFEGELLAEHDTVNDEQPEDD